MVMIILYIHADLSQQFLKDTQKNYYNTLFSNLFSPLLIIQTIIPQVFYM